MKKTLLALANTPNVQPLSLDTQAQCKGGWLWCCEEKRRNIGSYSYTIMEWRLVNDGKWTTSIQA
jgi:hypothetical protein